MRPEVDLLPTSAYQAVWALDVTTAHCARCQITSMVLYDMTVGSNYTAPGSPCSPEGSESAISCLTARGENREGQTDVAMISSEFLCDSGAQCHCQRLHSVTWSENMSVCPLSFLFLKVKCRSHQSSLQLLSALDFTTDLVAKMISGQHWKRAFISDVCLFVLDIVGGEEETLLNYRPRISQLSPGWWMSICHEKENSAEQHWTSICNPGPKHGTLSSNWDCMH